METSPGYLEHQQSRHLIHARGHKGPSITLFQGIMGHACQSIYESLHSIYAKHRRRHKENPDSKQMCCMWSTNRPPDIIQGTKPLRDIESAFHLQIEEAEALELYDMNLDEAAGKILEMLRRRS